MINLVNNLIKPLSHKKNNNIQTNYSPYKMKTLTCDTVSFKGTNEVAIRPETIKGFFCNGISATIKKIIDQPDKVFGCIEDPQQRKIVERNVIGGLIALNIGPFASGITYQFLDNLSYMLEDDFFATQEQYKTELMDMSGILARLMDQILTEPYKNKLLEVNDLQEYKDIKELEYYKSDRIDKLINAEENYQIYKVVNFDEISKIIKKLPDHADRETIRSLIDLSLELITGFITPNARNSENYAVLNYSAFDKTTPMVINNYLTGNLVLLNRFINDDLNGNYKNDILSDVEKDLQKLIKLTKQEPKDFDELHKVAVELNNKQTMREQEQKFIKLLLNNKDIVNVETLHFKQDTGFNEIIDLTLNLEKVDAYKNIAESEIYELKLALIESLTKMAESFQRLNERVKKPENIAYVKAIIEKGAARIIDIINEGPDFLKTNKKQIEIYCDDISIAISNAGMSEIFEKAQAGKKDQEIIKNLEVLGFKDGLNEEGARPSEKEVVKKYRQLAKLCHTDSTTCTLSKKEADLKFSEISSARNNLYQLGFLSNK